jgi:hypothetical protein
MKRTFLFLLVISTTVATSIAQILSITPDYALISFPASEFSDAAAYIQNNSSVQRTIKWVRYSDVEPVGWYTTVCDDNNCYSPGTSSMTVNIAANSNGLLKLNVFANDVVGTGSYHLNVYDISDSANANAVLSVDVVTNPVGISNVKAEAVSIYPNPVKDVLYMNLDVSKKINSIDIHNVVGQKIKTITLEEGLKSVAISASDLKKGIYFIRIFSDSKEVATKTFSKD